MESHRATVEGNTGLSGSTRRSKRRVWRWLGLTAGVLLGAWVFSVFYTVPLKISKETTWVTGPLKSDGKQVDFYAAWEQETYPENMATDENGYRLVVQHLGVSPEAEPEDLGRVCEKLGLVADTISPDMTLETPEDYLKAYVAREDFDEAAVRELLGYDPWAESASDQEQLGLLSNPRRRPDEVLSARLESPWTLGDLPMLEAWLAENNPAMDLIGAAVRKPTFHIPLLRKTEDDLLLACADREVSWMRSFARALSARANYRIATGQIDGAINDIITCKRLGRHVGHCGSFVPILVGIAVEGRADGIGTGGSLEHPPTREQLRRLIEELDDLPPKAGYDRGLLFDRYVALDFVQAMACGSDAVKEWGWGTGRERLFGCNWSAFAKRINTHYDTLIATGRYPRFSFDPMSIISHRSRSEMMADMLAAGVVPACDAPREAARRKTCEERIGRIALAMQLYERDHGTLPPACTIDNDGKPLHSWRVVLLPYLGQQELHDRIRLDEPWDSQHNRQFHKEPVAFYQCPSATLAPDVWQSDYPTPEPLPAGLTTYAVVVGPEMPFEGSEGKPLASFGPKRATMILIVERQEPVCWMDPTGNVSQAEAEKGVNLPEGGGDGIASRHPGGVICGHSDGAARFFPDISRFEDFRKLLHGTAGPLP